MDVKEIIESKYFKGLHKQAQAMLETTLKDFDRKGFLEDADAITVNMLISQTDMYYNLLDEAKKSDMVVNKKTNNVRVNPALTNAQSIMKNILQLNRELGGTTKSRRTINNKEYGRGADTALDKLMEEDDENWGD